MNDFGGKNVNKAYIKSRMPRWIMNSYIRFSLVKRRLFKPVVLRKLKKIFQNDIEAANKGCIRVECEAGNAHINDINKIPVWICWWQGLDKAPELVKMCVDSIAKKMPSDRVEIKIITIDNLEEYIVLPHYIKEKFDKGIIDYTHMSDIVRVALLYKYGGMWIDSTYFMADEIDLDKIIELKFWTHWNSKIANKDFVTHGKWSCNLMYSEPGGIVPAFILRCWYSYWEKMNKLIDYQVFDYIIRIGYEEVSVIREMITRCPQSEPNLFELQGVMNKEFDENKWHNLLENTNLFKLSYKKDYILKTSDGKMTFWGYLVSQ